MREDGDNLRPVLMFFKMTDRYKSGLKLLSPGTGR
jgi:hypothetical protein